MPLPWVLIPHFWTNPNIIFSATFLISIPSISLYPYSFLLSGSILIGKTQHFRLVQHSSNEDAIDLTRKNGVVDRWGRRISHPIREVFFFQTNWVLSENRVYIYIIYIYIHHISIHFIHWLIIIHIFVCHSFFSVKSPTFTETSGTMMAPLCQGMRIGSR